MDIRRNSIIYKGTLNIKYNNKLYTLILCIYIKKRQLLFSQLKTFHSNTVSCGTFLTMLIVSSKPESELHHHPVSKYHPFKALL